MRLNGLAKGDDWHPFCCRTCMSKHTDDGAEYPDKRGTGHGPYCDECYGVAAVKGGGNKRRRSIYKRPHWLRVAKCGLRVPLLFKISS